ncbi:PIN domain-like protein [Neolentinus lepideus HHB14362 ss-1]|uniref:PIN domain-like protein n=1 Tax=Neolentinus lepideus HHB14362 ss-1 TaxID=1314782 RepID=A0A165SUL4_9AGAM|nr:PIN domain-like protein [Neolentinus lepideus HHB14362 ss-1]
MGVLGLTPFIQKTCPQIIKTLPNRVRDLAGKTIVFDGTLITSRLHFAQTPHRYRHVLGWYRLIRELRDSSVNAICVFDGKQRNAAKQLESERRRQVRKTDVARASLELERLQRLKKLKRLLNATKHLESSQQQEATSTLRRLIADAGTTPAQLTLSCPAESAQLQPAYDDGGAAAFANDTDVGEALLHELPVLPSFPYKVGRYFGAFEADFPQSTGTSDDSILSDSAHNRYVTPRLEEENLDGHLIEDEDLENAWLTDFLMPAGHTEPQISAEAIPDALAVLYLDYRRSIPALHSLVSTPAPAPTDAGEAQADWSMSKSQHQLMLDEGKVWQHLAQTDGENLDDEQSLLSLAERSSLVSQSYERRINPPTAETYEECKLILRAMGVPCIDTSGPFEAEALASSLVLQGHADYVASEDTDVLVYEAPLIRNITSRRDPLTLLSGVDIRSSLALSRAAFVDFLLLLGTDFSQRIKNVGPARALKFIRAHGSIEGVLAHETKYAPRVSPQEYLQQVAVARMAFGTLPPVPDARLLRQGEWDQWAVRAILERFRLLRATAAYLDSEWDHYDALAGNCFGDNPSAI